jgi:hypothetical protein
MDSDPDCAAVPALRGIGQLAPNKEAMMYFNILCAMKDKDCRASIAVLALAKQVIFEP